MAMNREMYSKTALNLHYIAANKYKNILLYITLLLTSTMCLDKKWMPK